jgi:hypothetical protein
MGHTDPDQVAEVLILLFLFVGDDDTPAQNLESFSQGSPSPSPSILVSGQLREKYSASALEVIWLQCWRPSHLKF